MNIVRVSADAVVIEDFPVLTGLFAFVAATVSAVAAGRAVTRPKVDGELVFAGIAGMVVMLTVGVLLTKRTVFAFDGRRRELTWRRRGVFGRRGGVVAFDRIGRVAVESLGHTSRSYRVTLMTTDGPLPMTNAYSVGESERQRCEAVRDAIEAVLGVRTHADAAGDITRLIESG